GRGRQEPHRAAGASNATATGKHGDRRQHRRKTEDARYEQAESPRSQRRKLPSIDASEERPHGRAQPFCERSNSYTSPLNATITRSMNLRALTSHTICFAVGCAL